MRVSAAAVVSVALVVLAALTEAKCPLAEKCSFVADKVSSASGAKGPDAPPADCPLAKAGCPYYAKHAQDGSLEETLAVDLASKCPMEKCPHYEVILFVEFFL